jgi:hypothetical protein
MRVITIAVAVGSALVLLSTAQVAYAVPRMPNPNPNRDQLEGYCNENGGIFFPPGVGGAYACLLPDGTLIACGGLIPWCTQSFQVPEDKLSDFRSTIGAIDQLVSTIKTLEQRLENLEIRATKIEQRLK